MPAPVNTVPPVITGTLYVGAVLTSNNGTWTGLPTSYTYQWMRALTDDLGVVLTDDIGQPLGVVIAGATAASYTLVAADLGDLLFIEVTASNASGSTYVDSLVTAAIAPAHVIIDTDILQKPVDCVLAGDQLIKDRYREWTVPGAKTVERPMVSATPRRRLTGQAPSFTVKTDKRGYD